MMNEKLKVGILGATGMVGQRFIALLENHPWFEVVTVAASGRSAGKTYGEAVEGRWKMTTPIPEKVKDFMVLDVADIEKVAENVDFVFSAVNMTKDEIKAIEEAYAKHEVPVVSNNSAHRWTPDVPMEGNVGAPQVAYKETIRKSVEQDTKYARQSGGKGQYGHVKIRVEPNEPGKGYEFVNAVVGGAIPKEYIPAVDAGIQGAMSSGVLAGYSVVDVKVTLFDGSYHEVDSSEMAFKIAGSMAFKEACKKANPAILEPIMKVSVTVPDEYMGTVIGDITARRGNILGQITRTGAVQIDANVPLAEMFGYATDLRSKTQGRGNYSMEPSHNAELPKSKTEEIIKARGKA